MKPVIFLAAAKVLIDSKTNNLNLFDVLDTFTLKGEEPPPPDNVVNVMATPSIVVRVDRSDAGIAEVGSGKVELRAPDGSILMEKEFMIDLNSHAQHRTMIEMQGVPVKGEGRYEFVLLLSDEGSDQQREIARYPVSIKFESTAQSANVAEKEV